MERGIVINVVAESQNTLLMLKNVPNGLNNGLRLGILKAILHLRSAVDKSLASGEYGIKTKSGRLRLSLQTAIVSLKNTYTGIVGTNLVYARIQEEGGTTRPTVTPKSKKFFWSKFFETGDVKWKWMALTNKSNLTVKIPEHWYMRKTSQRESMRVNQIIDKEVSRGVKK